MITEEEFKSQIVSHKADSFSMGMYGCSCGFKYQDLTKRKLEQERHFIKELVDWINMQMEGEN